MADASIEYMPDVSTNNTLFDMSGNIYDELHIKIAFMLFIIFCILNTDIFAEHVLGKLSKKNYDREQDKISDRGIFVSGLFMSASYLILDLLSSRKVF